MHKLPDKMSRGWKRHADAFNDLREYAGKTRPIPAHGYRETVNGTMPPPLPAEILPQFTPRLLTGASPVLNITPGYVYGAWHDGAAADSSTQQTPAADFPEIQAAIIEPKIITTLLTANPPPGISITYPGNTYFFLKLTWKAYRSAVQGSRMEGDIELKPDISASTGSDEPRTTGDAHTHTIAAGVTVVETSDPGVQLDIDVINYILSAAVFVSQVDQPPPTETEMITYIPAGYISLDDSGEITTFGDDDGWRWFLQGAITAHRPPHFASGFATGIDRTEPIAPTAAETYTIPGQETDA